MKTKTMKVCDAIFIDVACEYNDSTDIKCGGPAVLGYEFYASPDEDIDSLKKFIIECLKINNRKFMGISISTKENFPVKYLWSRENINECITNNPIV